MSKVFTHRMIGAIVDARGMMTPGFARFLDSLTRTTNETAAQAVDGLPPVAVVSQAQAFDLAPVSVPFMGADLSPVAGQAVEAGDFDAVAVCGAETELTPV